MFKTKKEVQELAQEMRIKIKGLYKLPEIKISPIFFEDGDQPYKADWLMTYAKFDNGMIHELAKVSDQYALVQHFDAIGQTLDIFNNLPEFNLDEVDVKLSDKGGRCWTKFTSSKPVIIEPGDEIFPQVTLVNSCDTSKRFGLNWGAIRQICTNGMMGPDDRIKGGSSRKLHKKGTLSLEEEIGQFAESFEDASSSLGIWKEYTKLDITGQQFEDVMVDMGLSENQQEDIMVLPLRGEEDSVQGLLTAKKRINGWKAYNAITQWITDGTENQDTALARGMAVSVEFDKLLK